MKDRLAARGQIVYLRYSIPLSSVCRKRVAVGRWETETGEREGQGPALDLCVSVTVYVLRVWVCRVRLVVR